MFIKNKMMLATFSGCNVGISSNDLISIPEATDAFIENFLNSDEWYREIVPGNAYIVKINKHINNLEIYKGQHVYYNLNVRKSYILIYDFDCYYNKHDVFILYKKLDTDLTVEFIDSGILVINQGYNTFKIDLKIANDIQDKKIKSIFTTQDLLVNFNTNNNTRLTTLEQLPIAMSFLTNRVATAEKMLKDSSNMTSVCIVGLEQRISVLEKQTNELIARFSAIEAQNAEILQKLKRSRSRSRSRSPRRNKRRY